MALTTQEIKKLGNKKVTSIKREFNQMQQLFPDRVSIVSEGDSWFAYPPKWILWGKQSNIIAHISSWTRKKANFYSMASNGDEAVDMVSGKQKHQLVNILRWHQKAKNRKPIDILLFSGGGNDVVGENDFERFLKPFKESYTSGQQCVNMPRLNRKVKQIGIAYQELLDIRDHYSPNTLVITHTYDFPYPSLNGGVFLGGLIKTKAWMKRFMDKAMIKPELQAEVIKVFIDAMADEIIKVGKKRNGLIVVDTRGTLQGKKAWLNEIHPTSIGFKAIAELMFEAMKNQFPALG
jgi:hypothetical protein